MSDRRRLLGNMASLFTLQGANYILPLITLPYLVRILGPEKFGMIAFAQAFIQYFVVLTDYGFNLSATRDIAIHRNNSHRLGEIIVSVMVIKVFLLLCGAVLLLVLIALVPTFRGQWGLYLVVYSAVLGNILFPTWLFQGLERMKDITWMNIVARAITTGAIFVFVHGRNDYIMAAAIQSTPLLLAAVPAWLVLDRSKTFAWVRPMLTTIKEQLRSGWHVFLSTAAVNVYTSSNTFVLGLVAGPTAVGYFSAANKVIGAIQGLLTPVTQTLYPHISNLANRSQDLAVEFIRKVLRHMALAGLVLSFSLFVMAGPIVHIVLGPQYGPSITIMEWLAFLPFLIALSNVYGIQTMLTFGMNETFSRILIASAGINLVLVFRLARYFSGDGAAMSMLCTEIFVTVVMGLVLHRRGIHLYRPTQEAL